MKPVYVLLATAAIFASAACNAENNSATSNSSAPIEAVKAPNGDWTKLVVKTPEGGFLMGNPNADVKVIEFGSMTCPHCAEFDEVGAKKLINDYVKTGRVSFEFRNFVRDPLDITISMITRCAGPERFFQLTEAAFKGQRQFFETLQAAPADQLQSLQSMQGTQAAPVYARLSGLQQWAAQHGLPSGRQQQCFANQAEADLLVQMNGDATTQFPNFSGTPSFVINGKMLEQTATWDKLEPQLRAALGG
jgi:protein-disulfide isomerase